MRILEPGLVAGALLTSLALQAPSGETQAPASLASRLSGTLLLERPGGNIGALTLPDLTERDVRSRAEGQPPVFCVAGPASSGRIVFVDSDDDSHALRQRLPDGREALVFEAPGDALFDDVVGEQLAICPREALVAAVVRCKEVEDSILPEGWLELWKLDEREKLAATAKASGDVVSWFPDGKRIAYTAMVPRAEAAELLKALEEPDEGFARKLRSRPRVHVVHVLDIDSGETKPLHVGARPAVSPDGRLLLVQDFTPRWRLLDLESGQSRAFAAPEAIQQGALCFVDPHTVLYWGKAAAKEKGPRPVSSPASLRLVDLRTGESQVIVPLLSTLDYVSYGPGRIGGD